MATKKKTQTEIAAEATALRELKPKVRQFTAFGDSNHALIDIQLYVLEHPEMNEHAIYHHGWSSDQESAAMEARAWMDGEAEEGLTESWKALAK